MLAFFSFAVAGCGGGSPTSSEPAKLAPAVSSGGTSQAAISIPFHTIESTNRSAIQSKETVVVRDEAAWKTLWERHVGVATANADSPILPAVDFSRDMVLGIFLGARNYCDGVSMLAVKQHSTRIEAAYRETTPGPDVMCIALVGTPALMAVVPKSALPVEFMQVPEAWDELSIKSGWKFGFCLDKCEAAVEIGKDGATFRMFGNRSVRKAENDVERAIWGEVTAQEWDALKAGLATLPAVDTTIGCPDCADQGAEWVEVRQAGKKTKVQFSCQATIPGAEQFQQAVRAIRRRLASQLGAADPCAGPEPLPGEAVSFQYVPTSVFPSAISDQRFVTIRDAAAWQALWTEHTGGRSALPPVDFSREMVLGVFIGSASAPCGSTSIEQVRRHANPDRIEVGYRVTDPGPGVMCIMANLNQYSLVTVPASSLPVGFIKLQ